MLLLVVAHAGFAPASTPAQPRGSLSTSNTPSIPAVSRRTAAATLAAAVVLRQQPVVADSSLTLADSWIPEKADGSWTNHEGPFDASFFADFTATPNGFVYKKVTSPDTEKPVPFQKVFVHYTGYLEDGTKFDSSYDREVFSFRLGKGKVIPGWEATVGGMTVGQKVIVKIPAQYAYGDKKIGPIPPNSNLIFYIELKKLGGIKGDKPRLGSQAD